MRRTNTVRGVCEGVLSTISSDGAADGHLLLVVDSPHVESGVPLVSDSNTVTFEFAADVARRFLPFIGSAVRLVIEADAPMAEVGDQSEGVDDGG